MNCKKIKQHLIFLAEGKVQPEEFASAIHEHLAQCPQCSLVYQEIEQTLAVIEKEKQVQIDPWFAARVEQQFINMQIEEKGRIIELRPVIKLIRIAPIAASLLIALWLGILIGSELSPKFSAMPDAESIISEPYDELLAEDIYSASLDTFFLNNGDK